MTAVFRKGSTRTRRERRSALQGVVVLIVVALVSLLVSRIATVALVVTGMTRPGARFQARSALTGVGFTTSESELVVNHPVRRRIVMTLMLVGNLGLATAVAGILGGFVRADTSEGTFRAAILVGGLGVVYALSRSDAVDRRLSRAIGRALNRYTDLDVRDYERLLQLSGGYSIKEMPVTADSWIADRTLGDLRLRDEGILVLGVTRRSGEYVGVPNRGTRLNFGDAVIVYGHDEAIHAVSQRRPGGEGEGAHKDAVRRGRAVWSTRTSRRTAPASDPDR